MASNTTLNPGASGDVVATKERTHDGDATKVQVVTLAGVTGTEGSYTFADVASGAGAESAALRVTLATESLAALETIELGATSLAALESLTTITTVTTVGAVTSLTNALPAGTNNIGDVDVLSIIPGTGATNLGKAEDAAHTSADTGVMALAVRRDADTTLVDTTGDYAPLQVNAAGSLKVAITSGAGSGGTSIADGASFTRDTTSVTLAAAAVETSAPTLTNGDAAALSMTTGGALRVAVASGGVAGILEDAASAGGEEGIMMLAVRRDAASSGVSADGDFAALSVTSDGSLRVSGGGGGTQYAVDAVAGASDTGTMSLAVRDDALAALTPVDGDYTQLRTNARGAQWVALDSTVAQTVTLAAGTATNEVVGDAAQDAAIAGNPVAIGLRASTATPTAMSADGDVVYAWADRNGAQVVVGNVLDDAAFTPATNRVTPVGYFADDTSTDSIDEGDAGAARMTLNRKQIAQPYESEANTWSYAAAAGGLVNTTGVTAKTAAGAGLRNYITSIQVMNSHQTTGTEVLVRDGAAGTVIHRGWAAPNSGYAATFPVALRGTANTLVEIGEVTTTATAGVLVNLQGYIGA